MFIGLLFPFCLNQDPNNTLRLVAIPARLSLAPAPSRPFPLFPFPICIFAKKLCYSPCRVFHSLNLAHSVLCFTCPSVRPVNLELDGKA